MERLICIGVVYQSMFENLKWERALKGYVKMIQMNYSFSKLSTLLVLQSTRTLCTKDECSDHEGTYTSSIIIKCFVCR